MALPRFACPAVLAFLASSALPLLAAPIWVPGPAAPGGLTPRFGHAMAYDAARARVLLFGGFDGTVQGDCWEYDGTSWAAAACSGGAGPRAFHAMAYDAARQVVVMYGGSDGPGSYLGDTWEHDGTGWAPGSAAPAGLTPREFSAMAYDAARGVTVLFGGSDGFELDDTWELDATGWNAGAAPASGMAPRLAHTLVYHAARGTVLLFGGNSGGVDLDDAWELSASGWSGPIPASPGLVGRSGQGMAYDAGRGVAVMFGGNSFGTNLDDTWELPASGVWTPGAGPALGLYPRALHAMAYMDTRSRVVLFGGGAGSTGDDDTWEYTPWGVSFVTGQGAGQPNANRVRVFTASGQASPVDFYPYAAGTWGARAVTGVLTRGLRHEIVTGPGPGDVLGPQVRAFSRDGTPVAKVNFFAYGTLKFGVNAGTGSVDADAFDEMITGPGPGAVFGPHVRGWNFDNAALSTLPAFSFFAYGTLKFGANVAEGQVDGDAFREVLTGPGPGVVFSPQVRGFNYDGAAISPLSKINFNAYTGYAYGAHVAGGDVDGDAFAEIAVAPGAGAGIPARFVGFDYDGTAIAAKAGFDVTPYGSVYGGRVGLADVSGDGIQDLLTGPGPDPFASALVESRVWRGGALAKLANAFTPFIGGFGVNVEGGSLGY